MKRVSLVLSRARTKEYKGWKVRIFEILAWIRMVRRIQESVAERKHNRLTAMGGRAMLTRSEVILCTASYRSADALS